ncbi:MAG: ABC transporter ATP-binding protein [Candidatus Thiodiazotropha endolucinida]|uniref:ABC transporter ATP-binding protein n=1 Tax=Candidatus Thiodiazotropha taylori TaxID=2792791 RepID=A0A9E4NNN2_9GAMM|nr:ABC transporter ATP-binding protein [Candidatus Thiodiazotropha taylori]MCW4238326.1 ABC transporter ATP-binding protein [Candidatus Thiodiazotropha endolucinida]
MLKMKNVSKSYGSLKVTDDFSLDLDKGQALGILGPNGAGKSTLFNLITGSVYPDAGSVSFAGKDITRVTPYERCRKGIGRSYQIPHPFEKMTVFENLMVGATFGAGRSENEAYASCHQVLSDTGLLPKANNLAGSLSLLERKRLELARALVTNPELLLLDEIAGGLTEAECHSLIETIQQIHAKGTTIVWIEHVVNALLAVVGKLLVIDFGRKVMEGDPEEVMGSPQVQEIYMGISG